LSFEGVEQTGAVDYMLRTTQQHHVQLSLMADQKANIMIAATSILLTFSFANFKQQNLFWGFLALFMFSFISLVLAILAVTPRVKSGSTARRNLLFFGDFTDLSLDDYSKAMDEVVRSDQRIYEAVVTDIYALGEALKDNKYRYLSLSYRWFLTGILSAGALFVLQTALFYFT
jgi:hypothetical protein